jgi:hypothetical protein
LLKIKRIEQNSTRASYFCPLKNIHKTIST